MYTAYMEKDTIFRKHIPLKKKNSKLASIHEELVLKSPFDLWKCFICDDFIKIRLEQTLL